MVFLRFLIFSLSLFFLRLNCTTTVSNNNSSNDHNIGDTILVDNELYLIYCFTDSLNYRIKWGIKGSFENLSTDTYKLIGSGAMEVKDYNEKVIYLTQSCGTGCSYGVFLILSRDSKVKEYYHAPMIYDLDKNLVVYEPNIKGKSFWFVVENYKTGKQLNIMENVICRGPTAEFCVQDISFRGDKLHINHVAGDKQSIVNTVVDVSSLK